MTAIRTAHPLVGDDSIVGGLVDGLATRLGARRGEITPRIAAMVRRELRRLGYDGIIVWDGGGDGIDYVIALVDEAVKVVLP